MFCFECARYTDVSGGWMAWTFERTGEIKVISADQITARVEALSLTEILTQDYKKSAYAFRGPLLIDSWCAFSHALGPGTRATESS
jgi:hypothetical protein